MKNIGVENPSQSLTIKEKKKQTLLNNFDVEYPLQSKEIKIKVKKTFKEHYGFEHPLQSEEIKNKIKQTNLEKYGVEHLKQSHIFKEFLTQEWWDSQSSFLDAKELIGNNISESKIYLKTHKFRPDWNFRSSISQPHQRVINLLNEHQIEHEINDRRQIKPYELDIYIPSKSLAIEVNGVFWHTEEKGRGDSYHKMKTKMCKEKGIHLLNFTDVEIEQEWKNVKSIIILNLKSLTYY